LVGKKKSDKKERKERKTKIHVRSETVAMLDEFFDSKPSREKILQDYSILARKSGV
jgi:hypothetical protein